MEIDNDTIINDKKNNNCFSFNENVNNKEDNNNTKLLLNDGIFRSKIQGKNNFLFNKDLSTNKRNFFSFPNCQIISSLFTKDNIVKSFNQSISNRNNYIEIAKNKENDIISNNEINKQINFSVNDKNKIKDNNNTPIHIPNPCLINYKIYNIKETSIFSVKICGKNIKYFPIFTILTELEKFICYNPLIENNQNFEIISSNYIHKNFYIKNYNITPEKLEFFKDKYVKHLYTKKNIISVEEIFKYIFEEIKINLSCINVQSPYDDILKNCSNLINNINEIIDDILKDENNIESIELKINNNKSDKILIISDKKINLENTKIENINNFEIKNNKKEDNNYIIFNNNKIKKNIILNNINSNCIENNFFDYNKNINLFELININPNNDKNNNINNKDDLSEDIKENNNNIDEKNKKETFPCPYCSRMFTSHCGLGGHMSKRHPKNQNK